MGTTTVTAFALNMSGGSFLGRWARVVLPEDLAQGTLTVGASTPNEWEIPTGGMPLPWLEVMINDINEAARLPEGWDSYGGEQLNQKAAVHSIELLERMEFNGAAPWVAPTSQGGLHLEWDRGDLGVEIVVSKDGEISVLVEDDSKVTEWSTTPLGDDDLRAVLRRLTLR